MEKMIIRGGNQLNGRVKVDGAKNAVLPILAATILASEGQVQLTNVPLLSDVTTMSKVLEALNIQIDAKKEKNEMTIDASGQLKTVAPFDLVSQMRASIVVMGPLLARFGHAKVALPGGCNIGTRPIDLHLKGLEAMGADITITAGYVEAKADKLLGASIYLDFPSVGATQNIMMAATLAEGETIIENVAQEPEIVDLANMLNLMGANVIGAGTETIRVRGVESLHGCEHSIIPDRIEAGTFMIAAAITQGDVIIEDALVEHNTSLLSKLREMNVFIQELPEGIRIVGPNRLLPTDVITMPYPGFPTDMQAQMTIAQLMADGVSTMTETVFENRFMHLDEMRRMNSRFQIEGKSAIIFGPSKLQGAEVASTDLRAAAALILAGLVSEGYTQVTQLQYLDRGYHKIDEKLHGLGADIIRVNDTEEAGGIENFDTLFQETVQSEK